LSFPFPFPQPCDFEGANEFLAQQLANDANSAGLMLVHPNMTAEVVERTLDRHRLIGFKPYRNYAASGDIQNCRISEFMPEHLIEIADRRGALIMMHVSKQDAIADPENVAELLDFAERFPRAKWILAHCARSYSAWAIERAAPKLRALKNVWYDVSSVCETDAMVALIQGVGPDRVMYGSDDLPIGMLRGKYITFGYAWAYLSETNHQLSLPHCDPRMTFTRYEQLRAMRRAAQNVGLTRPQIEAMFFHTANNLVATARITP
jgi:glutamate-1-semialdehyde 2,1-aminomutase